MILKRFKRLIGDIHYSLNSRDHALLTHLTPTEKRKFLRRFSGNIRNFVETGTYLGETTAAMSQVFDCVHTIEIDKQLYERACTRFSTHSNIFCHHGDSAHVLPRILPQLIGPTLFWLDGHYSGPRTGRSSEYDSPILAELELLFARNIVDDIILIDDARMFVGRNSYPRIGDLNTFVRSRSKFCLTIKDDIIRLIFDPEWS